MKTTAIAYILMILLLAAVDYGAVREIANGKRNPAFEYIVLAISTFIVATLLSRLLGRKKT